MTKLLVPNQLDISLLLRDCITGGTLAQAQTHKAPPEAWSPLDRGVFCIDNESDGDGASWRMRPALIHIAENYGARTDAVAIA